MGFKIEKPAPDVLKCACYPCPIHPPSSRLPPFGPPFRKRSRYERGLRYRSRRAQKSITVLSEVIERTFLALFDARIDVIPVISDLRHRRVLCIFAPVPERGPTRKAAFNLIKRVV